MIMVEDTVRVRGETYLEKVIKKEHFLNLQPEG